jgi:hypothetical protein
LLPATDGSYFPLKIQKKKSHEKQKKKKFHLY